ncbi:MAG: hypothetical protein DYG87_12125 [Anaerolineae bacterium CFX3]|nr:hypothetical protein [Anaerolineae bacterium CFX3]MCQ3947385.1 hypothetical protein [Anaerolineae bacterium]RIK24769.1 MAG: hypothetical protein DCC54_12755 [Anaerolineae bacterium]
MATKREAKLWKELRWRDVLLAGLITIILIAGYFYIAGSETLNIVLQEFLLSIIANLIPTPLLFIVAYVLFNRLEELRSERDSDELAEKVASKLRQELAETQATATSSNNMLSATRNSSPSEMKLRGEFEVKIKSFEAKLSPQEIIIECTYRGKNPIRIKSISFFGTKLNVKNDLAKSYTLDDDGRTAIIPVETDKSEMLSGKQYTFVLVLAKKLNRETLESWYGTLGYVHFGIEYGDEVVDIQKAI